MTTVRPIGPAVGKPVTPLSAAPQRVPAQRPASGRVAVKERSSKPMVAVALVVAALLGLTTYGAQYYRGDSAARVRDPLHPWLRPSGYVGQTAGIIALSIFIFLWLYPLRKSVRWLRWTGAMSKWLDIHIATALVLPVLTAVHASWRFEGVIGLGYWSMIVVCLSGVVGRFLYVHIPRSASGLELNAEEIAAERRQLLDEVATKTGLPQPQVEALLRSDPTPCEGLGFWATVKRMAADEIARKRAARALKHLCATKQVAHKLDRRAVRRVVKLASQEMALTQQVRMLGVTHRLFRLWHVAHRPFAVVALVAVLVHVGVVIGTGMTWFW